MNRILKGICVAWLGAGVTACSEPHVYIGLVDQQPTQAELGRLIVVEAGGRDARSLRLSVRGGKLATVTGEPVAEPSCLPIEEEDLEAYFLVFPDNVEAIVSAEIVDADAECSKRTATGGSDVLVVTSGSNSTAEQTTSTGGGSPDGGGGGAGGGNDAGGGSTAEMGGGGAGGGAS